MLAPTIPAPTITNSASTALPLGGFTLPGPPQYIRPVATCGVIEFEFGWVARPSAEFGQARRGPTGVSATACALPPPSRAPERPTQRGDSARLAVQRGFTAAGLVRNLRPAHLLVGILQAQVGTVPRALALMGIDRASLLALIKRTSQ